jgi:hypothetical protein
MGYADSFALLGVVLIVAILPVAFLRKATASGGGAQPTSKSELSASAEQRTARDPDDYPCERPDSASQIVAVYIVAEILIRVSWKLTSKLEISRSRPKT